MGTIVQLKIDAQAEQTMKKVFDRYADDDYGFAKTHVPVRLARYGNEQLVSRSQAKRVLSRFENFAEVLLDFNGVDQIGQAFADEIFRVFKAEHPGTIIKTIHVSPQVGKMIRRAEQTRLD